MAIKREQAIREHVIHREDHDRNRLKLRQLYGLVADRQNSLIVDHCAGRVLDVGAGYGNLTRAVLDAGLECVGIEIDQEKIHLARQWFGVELQDCDIHDSQFADDAFDTVVFREVIRHLRLDQALREAARIAAKRLIIFQANPVWPLRLANRLAGHREHAQYSRGEIIAALERVSLKARTVIHTDPLAFPLSGGYIGPQLMPKWRWVYKIVLGVDRCLRRVLQSLGLGPYLCYRVLIVADKGT